MDDGHSDQNGRRRAYRFSTNSFHPNPVRVYFLSFRAYPLEDKWLLVQVLRYNFGIHATIQKNHSYYILYIRSLLPSSTQSFLYLILPYLHMCFDYKIQWPPQRLVELIRPYIHPCFLYKIKNKLRQRSHDYQIQKYLKVNGRRALTLFPSLIAGHPGSP